MSEKRGGNKLLKKEKGSARKIMMKGWYNLENNRNKKKSG